MGQCVIMSSGHDSLVACCIRSNHWPSADNSRPIQFC